MQVISGADCKSALAGSVTKNQTMLLFELKEKRKAEK